MLKNKCFNVIICNAKNVKSKNLVEFGVWSSGPVTLERHWSVRIVTSVGQGREVLVSFTAYTRFSLRFCRFYH